MRATLTSLVALAVVSMPVASQISGGIILREPKTTLLRIAMLSTPNPSTARRGQQNVTVQVSGVGTHFSQGVTTLSFGSGVTIVSPVTVVSPTSASAVVSVDAAAPAGARAISASTGTEVLSLNDGFTVLENPDYFGKVCSVSTNLGMLYKGMSKRVDGFIDMAPVEDWFAVTAPVGTSLKLTLAPVGAGSEFEITTFSSCGTLAAGTAAGVSPKEIIVPAGPQQTILIRVNASRWNAASSRFSLTLSAN